ncbi:hypothetical protein X777_08096 [Ooceraea biroi]|uniref:Uncharacterized protein n=1 Tax=Ooceraea biroi TaxID=2015173 RepID=A0A026W9I4_OOCBI|nr:hypothetical protein X777_08096 [Ooceraea biroi]
MNGEEKKLRVRSVLTQRKHENPALSGRNGKIRERKLSSRGNSFSLSSLAQFKGKMTQKLKEGLGARR